VVVGAALSADVEAPTERFHSARLTRHGQSPVCLIMLSELDG
jgi:hypothetical protein